LADSTTSGVTTEAKLDRAIGYLVERGETGCPPGMWNGVRWGSHCAECETSGDRRRCHDAWLGSDEAKEFGSEEARG